MGIKLRTYLSVLVAGLSVLIMAFTFNTTKVSAANYNTGDLLTGFEISDGKTSHATGDDVGITFNWDATGKNLQNGDTWTIDLPGTLKVRDSDPNAKHIVTDSDGNEIGSFTLNSDNTIKVTFTNVEEKNDYKGSLNIKTGIGPGKDAVVGDNTVTFPTTTGDQNDNLNISVSTSNMTKKGTIGQDADGNPIITWQLLVNRNELAWNTVNVHDHITDPNMEYVKGSVKVYKASWTSPGYYQKDSKLKAPKDYSITEANDGFDLSINNNGANQMYAVLFTTKITDADNATNGTKFKNNATLDWTANGNGEPGSDKASGSVTGNTNTGNGEGNIKGNVILQKRSADENGDSLANAVYDLYNEKGEVVQSNLTTDKYGQINATGLSAGNYYFKEVTPPAGYQQNNNEIHFSITGQTTTPVHVEAKDEPIGVQLGSLAIEKLDSETHDYLQGAEFDIIDKDGKVVAHITTDENGVAYAYNLPIGTYTIHETKAPAGYIIGGDIEVSITADNLTPSIISVENDLEAGGEGDYSVALQKFDSENGTVGVPGAEYTLYDINGHALTTVATNEDGFLKVDNMLPGTYYFLETKAPEGFNLNPNKIWFTINDDNTNVGTLVTSDDPIGSDKDDEDNDGNNEGNTDENDNDGDGIIVDPGDTDNNNGSGNVDEGENPLRPTPPYEGNGDNDESATYLPQTGTQKGTLISIIGLFILTSVIYIKRRKA